MTSKTFPTDTLDQAQSVIEAWKEIDPALLVGQLTPVSLAADVQQAVPIQADLDSLDAQLTDVRNRRPPPASPKSIMNIFYTMSPSKQLIQFSLSDLGEVSKGRRGSRIKRVRAGVKGIYGDDSSQYEMIGGTRMSERKPPARKPAA